MAITQVKTAQIRDSQITSAKLADVAVTASKIGVGAVTTSKIGMAAVNASRIANGAVIASKIGNGAVIASKIANGAVIASKIGSGAVTSSKIAANAVGSAKMKNSALTLVGLKVTGNTYLLGTTVVIQATQLVVKDPMITVGSGATGASAIVNANGLEVDRGTGSRAAIYFNESAAGWFAHNGVVAQRLVVGTGLPTWVYNEAHTFSSTVNAFNLAKVPSSVTALNLYLNGQRLRQGGGNDFTLAASRITMLLASVLAVDVVLADYRY